MSLVINNDLLVTNSLEDINSLLVNNSLLPSTAPTVASLDVSSGSSAGGTAVTITGTGFISGATVYFGLNEATGVVFVSATEITCDSPAGTVNTTVNVSVTNPGGGTGTLDNAFSYTQAFLFQASGESLTGWTNSGVEANQATSGYSPSDMTGTFLASNGTIAYINTGVSSFAGCTVQLDMACTELCDLGFGLSSLGDGPMFRLETRGGNPSGIGLVEEFNIASGPSSGETLTKNTWYTITLVVSGDGLSVEWYVNGVSQGTKALTGSYALGGGYIALFGDGAGDNGNFANIEIFAT